MIYNFFEDFTHNFSQEYVAARKETINFVLTNLKFQKNAFVQMTNFSQIVTIVFLRKSFLLKKKKQILKDGDFLSQLSQNRFYLKFNFLLKILT